MSGGFEVGAGFVPFAIPFIVLRFMEFTSNDCDRPGSFLRSDLEDSEAGSAPQCLIINDRLSSIGVNMLCCLLAGNAFG
jgi:hypothetical protein